MLARWMLENNRENPLLEYYDRLLDICRPYNVTLSLGDGLRPGAGVDAGDAAQWEEVINLGQLAKYALERGVQCMTVSLMAKHPLRRRLKLSRVKTVFSPN